MATRYTKADRDAVSDNPVITEERMAGAKPFREAFPDAAKAIEAELSKRGRPKLENAKEAVTLRLDPATLKRFKATGDNWRARMAEALDKAAP